MIKLQGLLTSSKQAIKRKMDSGCSPVAHPLILPSIASRLTNDFTWIKRQEDPGKSNPTKLRIQTAKNRRPIKL
uniref:Uncharacterized protein n=1 Tax=Rhizophora mucronata TaxID=61149 RepID=A0A2P2MTT2_RHIMU